LVSELFRTVFNLSKKNSTWGIEGEGVAGGSVLGSLRTTYGSGGALLTSQWVPGPHPL